MGDDHQPAAGGEGEHKKEAAKDFIPAAGYTSEGEQ
jgi:hypothetical protein